MTREDVMRLVIQAEGVEGVEIDVEGVEIDDSMWVEFSEKQLMLFAALVAAHEREACAEVCYRLGNDSSIEDIAYEAFREAEETIRKRGEVKP